MVQGPTSNSMPVTLVDADGDYIAPPTDLTSQWHNEISITSSGASTTVNTSGTGLYNYLSLITVSTTASGAHVDVWDGSTVVYGLETGNAGGNFAIGPLSPAYRSLTTANTLGVSVYGGNLGATRTSRVFVTMDGTTANY